MIHPTPISLKHSPLQKHKKQIHCKTPPPFLEPSTKPYKSKFTASLEYFTKLYEESTKQTLNNNNNKRLFTESSTELPFKPRQPTNTNNIPNCSVYKSASNIILPKDRNNRINPTKQRKALINVHFHRNKASLKQERCTTPFLAGCAHTNSNNVNNNAKPAKHNYDKTTTYLSSSPSDNATQQSSYTLNKHASTNKKYGYECYQLLKSIYTKIKQEEKFYNPDFNYKYTDYASTSINYSICYDNPNDTDDSKLFSLCYDLKDEILNTLAQLLDNFRKVKTSLVNKHKLCLEENKQFYRDITTCKEAIRDYLVDAGNPNTNVYGTNDLVKVFKKTYMDFKSEARAKVDEKESLARDLRSYRMMVDTYKNALSVAQGKVSVLLKEKEAMSDEVARLREENENEKVLRKGSEGGGATVMKTVGDAVKRLVFEIGSWNGKVKEYLDIIFKLVGVSESEVNEIYWMKENKKKMMTTFNK